MGELKKAKEENEKLSPSIQELWENNEYLNETRMKDKENLHCLEEKNSQLSLMLTKTNDKISLLENNIDQVLENIIFWSEMF